MTGRIEALTTGRDCTIWLLTREDDGTPLLWRGVRDGGRYRRATVAELEAAVERTTLTAVADAGFCLTELGEDGDRVARCFTWDGEPLAGVAVPTAPALAGSGQLLTRAIDSGLPRCRWHRVRVEADVPTGTSVAVAVASSEEATAGGAGPGPAGWEGCPAGIPHAEDWREGPPGVLDFLVDQPPGRYLYVRVRLTGDGAATPTVRRIRLDFPRVTSAELLPAGLPPGSGRRRLHRPVPVAVRRLPGGAGPRRRALPGPARPPATSRTRCCPGSPACSGWRSTPTGMPPPAGRCSAAAPELYRRRGTPWALREAIRIVFKVKPVIHELAADRDWAALDGRARLRSARLFGRSAARFRLGGSALSGAPLRAFGNPDDDPLTAQANRFRVLVPPRRGGHEPDRLALARLVERQAPAHTVAEVRLGGLGFVVGTWSAVGVDTAFTPLPAPVLARDVPPRGRAVRLGRHSVVWPGRTGRGAGVRVGEGSAVGIHTVAE